MCKTDSGKKKIISYEPNFLVAELIRFIYEDFQIILLSSRDQNNSVSELHPLLLDLVVFLKIFVYLFLLLFCQIKKRNGCVTLIVAVLCLVALKKILMWGKLIGLLRVDLAPAHRLPSCTFCLLSQLNANIIHTNQNDLEAIFRLFYAFN